MWDGLVIIIFYKINLIDAFLFLAAANCKLDCPPARGFDGEKLPSFPCGGQVPTGSTGWPVSGSQIALTMSHDRTLVRVLLGIGNDVSDGFNIVLLSTI